MSESAVADRRNGLIAAITSDITLAGLLQGEQIYVRRAPENAPLPYIMLAGTLEFDAAYLMQPGQEGVEDMTCWDVDIHGAQDVYKALYRALNKRKITVVNHVMIRGSLSYISDVEDATREAWGVAARYRCRTLNA